MYSKVRYDQVAFLVFCMIFPLGIIGTLSWNFEYGFLEYFKLSRGLGYILGSILCVFSIFSYKIIVNGRGAYYRYYITSLSIIAFYFCYIIQLLYHADITGNVSSGVPVTALNVHWPLILANTAMIYLGLNWNQSMDRYRGFLFFSWLASCAFVILSTSFNVFSLDFTSSRDPADRSFTLMVSDSFSILSLAVMGVCKKDWFRWGIFLLSIIMLFFISSRTALVIFGFTGMIFLLLVGRVKTKIVLIAIFFPVIIFLGFYFYEFSTGYSSRIFRVSTEDSSLIGRMEMLTGGLRSAFLNPLVGDFGGQLEMSYDMHGARWGGYIHGSLSYFRQFGLIAAVCVVLFYFMAFRMIFDYATKIHKRSYLNFVLVVFYVVIVTIFSRSYAYPWLFLIPGFYLSYIKDCSSEIDCKT